MLPPAIVLVLFIVSGLQGMRWGTDFNAFFTAATTVNAGSWSIYDFATVREHLADPQRVMPGYPFPYMPAMALLLTPLSWLPYNAAFWAWTLAGMALLAWAQAVALAAICPHWPPRVRNALALLTSIASPFTLADTIAGQNGHICSALLLFALSQAFRRPWLAALCLALLALKPQIALLAVAALACNGQWRALIYGALATVLGLSMAVAVSGAAVWIGWLHYLPLYTAMLSIDPLCLKHLTASAYVTLKLLGCSSAVAALLCGISALVIIPCGFRAFRRLHGQAARWLIVAVAGMLLLPYVMWYDACFLNIPLIWIIAQARKTGFYPRELLALCACLALPPLGYMLLNDRVNVSVAAIMLLYAALLRRAGGETYFTLTSINA